MEEKVSTSGGATATSGAGEKGNTTQNLDNNSSQAEGKSAFAEKVLREKQNAMKRIAELEAKLTAAEEEKLAENEQYKQLAEQRLMKLQSLESEMTTFKSKMEKAKKVSAVKKHLNQMGLRPQHEDLVLGKLLDVDDLVIDPDTGAVLGADEKAKTFRQQYADLNLFGSGSPRASHQASISTESINKNWKELSKADLLKELKDNLSKT